MFINYKSEIYAVARLNLSIVDKGRVGALVLLDLSAAFDTVDHSILTMVMKERSGVDGSDLGCMTDFLSYRSQTVRSGKANSGDAMLQFGVPQRSVLGPRIFTARRRCIARTCYSNVAGWLAGCLSQPVLYQND